VDAGERCRPASPGRGSRLPGGWNRLPSTHFADASHENLEYCGARIERLFYSWTAFYKRFMKMSMTHVAFMIRNCAYPHEVPGVRRLQHAPDAPVGERPREARDFTGLRESSRRKSSALVDLVEGRHEAIEREDLAPGRPIEKRSLRGARVTQT